MEGSLRSRTHPSSRAASGTGSAARTDQAAAAIAATATARRSRARALAGESDAAERLGVCVPVRLAEVGSALANAPFDAGKVPELARVALQGLELSVHRPRDVDDDVGVLVAHEVDLAHLVGLPSLRQQFRKVHAITRVGIDGIEREAPRVPMVAVTRVGVEARERIRGDDSVRTDPPDLADDVPPRLAGVLELPVGVAEEGDVLDAKDSGSRPLLRLADGGQALRRHRGVVGAAVAAGE